MSDTNNVEAAAKFFALHARIERLEAALRKLMRLDSVCNCGWMHTLCPYCQAIEEAREVLREER